MSKIYWTVSEEVFSETLDEQRAGVDVCPGLSTSCRLAYSFTSRIPSLVKFNSWARTSPAVISGGFGINEAIFCLM